MLQLCCSTIIRVLLLAFCGGALSGCVILPLDGGYRHDHDYGDRPHYRHWDRDRHW